jgi:hypothetical protein
MSLAALPLAREVAERALGAQLEAKAKARGWEVSWERLALGYDLSLKLDGLRAQGAGQDHVTIQEIDARWSWTDLAQRRTLPARVTVRGLDARASLAATSKPQTTSHPAPLSGLDPSDTPQTVLKIEGAHVLLTDAGPLGAVELDALRLDSTPDGDGWRASLSAQCLQGCGEPQALRGEARFDGLDLRGSAQLERPAELALQLDGLDAPLRVSGQRVEVERLDKDGVWSLSATQTTARASLAGWDADLKIAATSARWRRLAPRLPDELVVSSPALTLLRAKPPKPPKRPVQGQDAPRQGEKLLPAQRLQQFLAVVEERRADLDRAWPLLQRLRVEGGSVSVPSASVELEGLGLKTGAEALELFQTDGLGRWALSLPRAPGPTELVLEGAQLEGKLPLPKNWSLRGKLSGRLSVTPNHAMPAKPAITHLAADLGRAPKEGLRVHGALTLDEGALMIAGLSEEPLQASRVGLEVDATYGFAQEGQSDALVVQRLRAALPSRHQAEPVHVNLRVAARRVLDARKPAAELWLEVEDAGCQAAFGAIPRELVPRLHDRAKLAGRFAPTLDVWVDLEDPQSFDFILEGLPGGCRLLDLGEYSPDFLKGNFKLEVHEGVTREGIFVGPSSGSFVRLKDLPSHVGAAAYLSEEIDFYDNPGFAITLIKKATRLNLERGRYVYGGSSVSQQLVKNLFLTRQKTLSRKLEEAFIVWRMEEVLTKDRILELYLNCIEFGENLYGIDRASRHYFGKRAAELAPMESVFLAALKPAPWYGDTFRRAGQTPDKGWWRDRMESLMQRLHQHGHITEQDFLQEAPYIFYFDPSKRGAPGPQDPALLLPPTPPGGEADPQAPAPPDEREVPLPDDAPAQRNESPAPKAPAPKAPTPTRPDDSPSPFEVDPPKKHRWDELPPTKAP